MIGSTIPTTKYYLSFLDKLTIFPFAWPKFSEFPHKYTSPNKILYYKLNLIIHLLYSITVIVNFLLTRHKLIVSEKMLGLLFLTIITLLAGLRVNTELVERNGLENLLKLFLTFEKKNNFDGQAEKSAKLTVFVQRFGIVSSLVTPILVGTFIFVKPCMPPFLGYVLSETVNFQSQFGCSC